MVRAKFVCVRIERFKSFVRDTTADVPNKYVEAEVNNIVMHAVSPNRDNPNDENSKFWDASPGGEFKLNVANAAAVAEFQLGKQYYFDIHEVPATS